MQITCFTYLLQPLCDLKALCRYLLVNPAEDSQCVGGTGRALGACSKISDLFFFALPLGGSHVGKCARRAGDTEVLLTDSFRFPCAISTQTLPFCLFWILKQEAPSWLGQCPGLRHVAQVSAKFHKVQTSHVEVSHRWQGTVVWKWAVPSPHQDHGFYLPSKRKVVAREGYSNRGGNCVRKSRLSLTSLLTSSFGNLRFVLQVISWQR